MQGRTYDELYAGNTQPTCLNGRYFIESIQWHHEQKISTSCHIQYSLLYRLDTIRVAEGRARCVYYIGLHIYMYVCVWVSEVLTASACGGVQAETVTWVSSYRRINAVARDSDGRMDGRTDEYCGSLSEDGP